jgi:NitT/TauT family transport system substrate-binding protein
VDQFRISATGSSPNYLPEYVSRAFGFFEAEDIAVASWVPSPWTGVLDDIDAGSAEAALGGLWVPAMYYGHVRNYLAFAQLNARFPMGLVTRNPVPHPGDWHFLEGKVVLVPGSGGVAPYQFLAGVLREAGVDISRIRFVHDLSGPMLSAMFQGGTGDALLVDGLSAATLLSKGIGQAVLHMDELCGPMPNSVYYAPPALLERSDGIASRFARALQRGMDWLATHPTTDLDGLFRERWPQADPVVLTAVVDGFRRNGVWSGTVLVDPAAYSRWHDILADGGLIPTPVAYTDVIDPRPAQQALLSARPAAELTNSAPGHS